MNKRRRFKAKRNRTIKRWTRQLNPDGNTSLDSRRQIWRKLRAAGGLRYAPVWY